MSIKKIYLNEKKRTNKKYDMEKCYLLYMTLKTFLIKKLKLKNNIKDQF